MIDLLVLGLGWQGTYVLDYFKSQELKVQGTTRDGRDGSIPFVFSPSLPQASYSILPKAKSILITFPLSTSEDGRIFSNLYEAVTGIRPNLILLGSTGAFISSHATRKGPVVTNPRFDIEEVFLKMGGCVLNLAGLWGGLRDPKGWLDRVAHTKEALANKQSLHLIHGLDVAKLVLRVTKDFTPSERWIVSDTKVYDWYELAMGWETSDTMKGWLKEIMEEKEIWKLPRDNLERRLDSMETWTRFGIFPLESLYHPR